MDKYMEIMGFKNIMVNDGTYKRLDAVKRGHESFNTMLNRLLDERKGKGSFAAIWGGWSDMTDKEEKELWESIHKAWGAWNERIRHGSDGRRAPEKSRSKASR